MILTNVQVNTHLLSTPMVTLTIDMLSDNANHVGDGGGLPALIDGKVSTYYHTKWNAPVTTEAHYVQIKLSKPLKDLCFEYDARQSVVKSSICRQQTVDMLPLKTM